MEDCRKAVLHCRDVEQKYLSYQQLLDSDIRPIMRTKVIPQRSLHPQEQLAI